MEKPGSKGGLPHSGYEQANGEGHGSNSGLGDAPSPSSRTGQSLSLANATHQAAEPLYLPHNPDQHPSNRFRRFVNQRYGLSLRTYEDLWEWSTTRLGHFWDAVWDYTRVKGHRGNGPVVDENSTPADNPGWFPDATLNWTENMLRDKGEKTALIQATEPYPQHPRPPLRSITYATLYRETVAAAKALRALGVKEGDRVASYSSHCIENIIASLATAAIGAIWTSAASDFGPDGVLERFEQVKPVVVFSVDVVSYNGKLHDHTRKLHELLKGLEAKGWAPRTVVIIPFGQDSTGSASPSPPPPPHHGIGSSDSSPRHLTWSAFLQGGTINPSNPDEFRFYQAPFDHPLWILFSSGTTGKPKPIVHRAGGMLLQSLKEFAICAGLRAEDVFFYYTTTGWMMWNFLVAGLATGCTLVLYDGSPLREPPVLWRLVEDVGITVFGTSAKYLEELSKRYVPNEHHDLSTLRHIYSTGSPLSAQGFSYVYTSISPYRSSSDPRQILLSSITGGTDICSLFAGFNSALPVYKGEIQCRMLGMRVEAWDEKGESVNRGEQGELVCTRPFPCQPLGFWPLEGYGERAEVEAAKERYAKSYFGGFKGAWYHGDHVVITKSRADNGGGVIMLGRSDGVLNPGGVRFGSAEIYEVLETHFGEGAPGITPERTVVDSLCVGQRIGSDERVLLFVKLLPGVVLSKALVGEIAKKIRELRTARHVPAECIQVEDVPYTLNGKKVEVPVRKIVNGAPLSSVNRATLRNSDCLAAYVDVARRLGADAARL